MTRALWIFHETKGFVGLTKLYLSTYGLVILSCSHANDEPGQDSSGRGCAYNMQTPQRTALLIKIAQLVDTSQVHAAF